MPRSTLSSAASASLSTVGPSSAFARSKSSGTAVAKSHGHGSSTAGRKSAATGTALGPVGDSLVSPEAVLVEQLTAALLDNRTLSDLTLHITTTQLHTATFLGHTAFLLAGHQSETLKTIDSLMDPPLSSFSIGQDTLNVHTNHARLPDLLAHLRSLYTDPDHVQPHMAHLLSSSALADCTLVVQDPLATARLASARAHKCILAARCPYFAALFDSPFADADLATYTLPADIFTSPSVFDNVLAFVYTAQLPSPPKSPVHVFDLFQCANFLGLHSLETHLETLLRTMVHGLSTCTCTACCSSLPAVLLFADRMELATLRHDAVHLFAASPLTLWTSLEFASFPSSLTSAIVSEFIHRAESDAGTLLSAIATLDTLLDRLAPRAANSKPTNKLVDTLTSTRDTLLVPQLVPNLPHLCTPGGPLDKPPLMDVPRRLDVLSTHLVPLYLAPANGVWVAFTLHTAHALRVQRAAAAAVADDPGGDAAVGDVTEALGHLAHVARAWVAKRWLNLALGSPPRGVYPASPAWHAFCAVLADQVGVSVDELTASAGGGGASVVGGRGGSVVGGPARQPRVRSMMVALDDGGKRPGIKKAQPPASTAAKVTPRATGPAVVGSRVDAGRPRAPAPRPASVVGGMVGAASGTSSKTPGDGPRPRLRPAGPPMNAALRAERAKSMIVTSSSTSAATPRPTSSLRPASSMASRSPSVADTTPRGRPATTSTAVRKVARSPSAVSTTSSVSSARRPSTAPSTRRTPSTPGPPPAIRRSVSMAALPSSSSSSTPPVNPARPTSSSPLKPGRPPAHIPPPVPPLPPAAAQPAQRKYDPARLERLRRQSAERAAHAALAGVAAVDLHTFVPSRIPAPGPSNAREPRASVRDK